MISEKDISYISTNTYTTVNQFSEKTKNVWLVFHGMGHLSRYFARHFAKLNAEENFIIAPQAPSKYYQGTNFKHVGASWLTKEETKRETQNVLTYIDAVWANEKPKRDVHFIVLGYSQGVSIATRWLASRKISCDHLVLHSGGIPTELTSEAFLHLPKETQVTYLYGDKDEYITEARKTEEQLKGNALFGNRLTIEVFDGIHEVYEPFLLRLTKK